MIKPRTFKGGLRLAGWKELTRGKAIQTIPLPPRVVIPLGQNIGAAPRPVVEAGAKVKEGEVIARPSGAVSSTLHASVTGKVKAISVSSHPAGPPGKSIEIETDPEDRSRSYLPPLKNWSELSPDQIRSRVLEAGIVGLGGAGFPTQIKLQPHPEQKIDYVVVNGAECEPFLTVDHRLLLEETDQVVLGLKIIMRATGAREGIVAIEANKMDAFRQVRIALGDEENLRVKLVRVKYPQGAEKQLIYSLFRREVPAGGLPAAVGCLVQNVHTALALAEAFREGKPLFERVVTVTGPDLKNPGNFRVRIGTPFSHLLQAAGGVPGGTLKVIAGGPMMGIAQCSLDTPVIKGTSGLLVLRPVSRVRNLACIRCGKCITVCPMGLTPSELGQAVEKKDWDYFKELGGKNCIECGCCAFVCPSARDLVQLIQLGKGASKS
jgi:electron transport complex protein RnfC